MKIVDERGRRIIYERTLPSLFLLCRVLSSMISKYDQYDQLIITD